ncbi:S8 family serine peptidase [Sulfobacillus sp. hq2]|uniref:S53 family peptidase n=1 Tax=Sulfobacillus sp. hq2 TaxID=2039167 RepID=UPI000CD167E1|nr:S53 family peptidase [Sulfobacillus sp. hq2]POB10322.1 peptidase [Sulfobacillus sp. hq2]
MPQILREVPGHIVPGESLASYHDRLDPQRTVEFAMVWRSADEAGLEARLLSGRPLTREELVQDYGWDAFVKEAAVRWLTAEGVHVTHDSAFITWLEGSMAAIETTLQIRFVESGGKFMIAQEPRVPQWLSPAIIGFVGLENVSQLYPGFRSPSRVDALANNGQGFFPIDIQTAYQFPPSDGTGLTIGLLEFSNGYNVEDVGGFWSQFGIPAPSLTFVSVDGTPNDGGVNPWDLEATLDIEWSGAMAPGASLVVYEASAGNQDAAFALSVLKALEYARNDTVNHPNILSISYGDGETRFPIATMHAWDSVVRNSAAIGMTVFVASGDEGAYGLRGPGRPICHVDAPANCPHVVAVGGTHLVVNAAGQIAQETGWTDTNNNGASGGGISQIFPVPSYQEGIRLPVKPGYKRGRGVPDVALNADPDTGYAVLFQGAWTIVGGTSVASPIWAALFARIAQEGLVANRTVLGYVNPRLYLLGPTPAFRPITQGNNSYAGVVGYECTPGWNAVTGWGSPVGEQLAQGLLC